MMRNMDLEEYISKNSNTLPIMDRFEESENGEKKYKRLIVKNIEVSSIGQYTFKYKLIIERIKYHPNKIVGDITMSDFKHNKGKVTQYASSYIEKYLKNHIIKNKSELYFDKPYYLRAQNSTNRGGYGWEWQWGELIYEGTQYGECDDYGFVGVVIESITKNQTLPSSTVDAIPDPQKIETITYRNKKYYKIYADDMNVFMLPYTEGMTQKQIIQKYKEIMASEERRGKH